MKNTQEKPGQFIHLSEGQALPPRSSLECDPNVIALEALTEALRVMGPGRSFGEGIDGGIDAYGHVEAAIARVAATIGASCGKINTNA